MPSSLSVSSALPRATRVRLEVRLSLRAGGRLRAVGDPGEAGLNGSLSGAPHCDAPVTMDKCGDLRPPKPSASANSA